MNITVKSPQIKMLKIKLLKDEFDISWEMQLSKMILYEINTLMDKLFCY